jgi:CAAX protease family protein
MDPPDPARTTRIALLFEGGLGAAALAIGWLVGQWPLVGIGTRSDQAHHQFVAVLWGLAATGPLLAALFIIDRFPIGPLRYLRDRTAEVVSQMFGGASVAQLAAVAAAAGLGEELLFRGLVQEGLSRLIPGPWGPGMALAVAAALFGICHWLNTTYALLAMLAGAYFGLIFLMTGSLWTPVVAHAVYDLIALIYLVRPNKLIGSKM